MLKHTTAACLLAVALVPGVFAQEPKAEPKPKPEAGPKLETAKDKASYLIGRNIGENIRRDEIDLDLDLLMTGLREAMAGKEGKISEEEAEKIMTAFQEEMQAKFAAKSEAEAKENVAAGVKYLEENKKRKGVTSTESGLQYEILTAGKGAKPTALDSVTVHYHGTLIDGTVFDSSRERGKPASFPVNGVIPGWTEALQLMPIGSKWKVFVPSKLAYGEERAGPKIGPNSTLIFEVELISIDGKKE